MRPCRKPTVTSGAPSREQRQRLRCPRRARRQRALAPADATTDAAARAPRHTHTHTHCPSRAGGGLRTAASDDRGVSLWIPGDTVTLSESWGFTLGTSSSHEPRHSPSPSVPGTAQHFLCAAPPHAFLLSNHSLPHPTPTRLSGGGAHQPQYQAARLYDHQTRPSQPPATCPVARVYPTHFFTRGGGQPGTKTRPNQRKACLQHYNHPGAPAHPLATSSPTR